VTKLNHVKTWKEKNYEKLILEFGEPKILSELKGRHIVKNDLNQIKTSVLEHYFSNETWSGMDFVRQKWHEVRDHMISDNAFNERPGSLINKDELQIIEDFQFMPREVNKAKDFDRIAEIEETQSNDQIMHEYLKQF